MTKEEAKSWLSAERTMMSIVPCEPFETWEARIAQADAEMTRRAYWLLRAHSENLADSVLDSRKDREKRIQEVALQLVARSSANVPYAFKLAEEYVCECERRDKTKTQVAETDTPSMYRCTVCGRIGSVGRCCGIETREQVKGGEK